MFENDSLLILNDDCIMQIFQRLSLMDYANIANTCRRLRDVARYFSSLKHKKIEIVATRRTDMITKQEFSKVWSVIGEHVLKVELCCNDPFILKLVKEKCKNLKGISVYCDNGWIIVQGLRNLTELTVGVARITRINEWKNVLACNPELEVLDYNAGFYHEIGLIELLTHLPKLHSLKLPQISVHFHRSPVFQHFLRLIGLTKLSLSSPDNLNSILVDLAKSLNLVELAISMEFDDKSLGIIKSFQNLKVLSITFPMWSEASIPNATVFPKGLQRLKISHIEIPCSKFLEIIQHLNFLKEFEMWTFTEIFWDNITISFKDSQEMVVKTIENTLIRNQRKLKILRCSHGRTLYPYWSDHLQIINSDFVNEEALSRRIYVDVGWK